MLRRVVNGLSDTPASGPALVHVPPRDSLDASDGELAARGVSRGDDLVQRL